MSWWKSLFPKRASDAQMNSELRFHIDELTDENIARGMPPEEARRRARLDFGGQEKFKEEVRDVYRIRLLDATAANLKSAFRFIRKSPTFSATVILTLALGIGANSAVFSAIDAILLRPLPFPDADQLMRLSQFNPKVASPRTFVAPVRLEDWNRLNSTFQALTGYYTENSSESSGALPERLTRAWTAPRFFQVWGIAPSLGREFSSQEETVGGPDSIIISDRFWRRRFSADPGVLGKSLRLDGSSFLIIGVMPASFLFPERDVDVWSPIFLSSPYAQNRRATWYTVIGRLKPGVTVAQAQANLATVQAQLGRQFPETDRDISVGVEPLKENTVSGSRRSLWILFGSVSLLLLIACTNIVALLLGRATQRQQEISVRFSLGAPRGAIVAQLLTETFVLALIGSVLGLFLAAAASEIFRSLAAELPRVDEIHLDSRIVLYSLACSVAATLLCGLVPAIRGTRRSLAGSLSQSSRTQVSGRNRLQWLLVGVQVALAVTLLAGAGLLIRSFEALARVSPGFETSHILTFRISANWGETGDMKGLINRIDRTIDFLNAVAGVESAATSATLPGVPEKFETEIKFAEGPSDPNRKIVVESRFVSPRYFSTMKIPLLEGEVCREQANAPQILVNRSFANAFLPATPPAGHHIQLVDNPFMQAPGEIRGVVGDAREGGLNREPVPTAYWCFSAPVPDPHYLVRTHTEPLAMAETIRQKIHDIEPARSVFDLAPLESHLSDAFSENRLRTILLSFFAATALSLACVGLYGTLSYSVNVRRREVGLRLALGALRGQILKQFLLQGLTVCLLGCIAGWALATILARLLSGLLYGVSPSDVPTLSAVILLVLLVAACASFVPAVRASRVEPMQVLRDE
jgi:putative ABC transport system permease protein